MNTKLALYSFTAASLCGEALPKPHTAAIVAVNSSHARQVQYREQDIIMIPTKLRFTTLIRLPKGEQILDFVCGDREMWQVTGVQNFAFVKPSKPGASTSLHLVTAAGTVYARSSAAPNQMEERIRLRALLEPGLI